MARKRTRHHNPRNLDDVVRGRAPDDHGRVRGQNQQHLLEREAELTRRVRAFRRAGGVITRENTREVMATLTTGLPWPDEAPLVAVADAPAAQIEALLAFTAYSPVERKTQSPVR
jgi:hypothetical protein